MSGEDFAGSSVERMGRPPGRDERLALLVVREAGDWPAEGELEALADQAVGAVFAELALAPAPASELAIVFSDDAHSRRLNARWRNKDKPTNVLSFPAMPLPTGSGLPPLLGDIVLAEETVRAEAAAEDKPFDHHLLHLMVHGLLHLLGFDHENEKEAEGMEALETRTLARLAIPDPYT